MAHIIHDYGGYITNAMHIQPYILKLCENDCIEFSKLVLDKLDINIIKDIKSKIQMIKKK